MEKGKQFSDKVDERVYDHYMDSLLKQFKRTVGFLEDMGDKMEIMQLRNAFSRLFEMALKNIEEREKGDKATEKGE